MVELQNCFVLPTWLKINELELKTKEGTRDALILSIFSYIGHTTGRTKGKKKSAITCLSVYCGLLK